jgi:hypothetical protein
MGVVHVGWVGGRGGPQSHVGSSFRTSVGDVPWGVFGGEALGTLTALVVLP